MKHKLLVLSTLFFTITSAGFAQNEDNDEDESEYNQPTEDIAKFFDDGTKSMASNAIKLDLYNSAVGSAMMTYERKITQSMSIEGGLGLSYSSYGSIAFALYDFGKLEPSKSLIYGVGCKFFNNQGAIDFGGYKGVLFLHKGYYFTDPNSSSVTKAGLNSVLFQQGFQIIKAKFLLLEVGYNAGLGFVNVKEGDPNGTVAPVVLDGNLILKLGFLI